jgi:hypothetical protein
MSEQPEKWEIYLSKADFDRQRSDPRLPVILNLARIVNVLNFCFRTLLQSKDDGTPAEQRQYFNSFLFACGILYEGLKVANTLGKRFGDRDSFRNGFGRLLKDKETKRLLETVLNPMRNKIVFHFEEDVMKTTVQELDLESYSFVVGSGQASGDAYYELADTTAINFIIGNPDSKEEASQSFRETVKSITQVLSGYTDSANVLIVDVLRELNWKRRESPKDS